MDEEEKQFSTLHTENVGSEFNKAMSGREHEGRVYSLDDSCGSGDRTGHYLIISSSPGSFPSHI